MPGFPLPPLPFTLLRSRRRTIALIVQADGSLVVRAPLRAPRRQIEQVVAQKADWVRQKQAYALAHPLAAPHRYVPGEKFWFLGKQYPLEVVNKLTTEAQRTQRKAIFKYPRCPLCLCGSPVSGQPEHFLLGREALPKAAAVFTAWYKAQAQALVGERVRHFAAQYGFSYRQVRITSARTRWGSCSTKGTLAFTWRLVLAPPECIDYVVVHELAHLRVANHSPAFWDEVEAMLPDYKARRKWLRVNGRLLALE
jgi:predicted metal-dependent hydrolase